MTLLKKIYYIFSFLIFTCLITFMRRMFLDAPFYVNIYFLSNISVYHNILYYIYSLGILLNFKFLLDFKKIYFKVCFILTFTVSIVYWIMVILFPETRLKLPYILDFFIHGGTFIINLLEHFCINSKIINSHSDFNFNFCCTVLFFYSIFLTGINNFYGVSLNPLDNMNISEFIVLTVVYLSSLFGGNIIFKTMLRKSKNL